MIAPAEASSTLTVALPSVEDIFAAKTIAEPLNHAAWLTSA
jgi:hypothetical protein